MDYDHFINRAENNERIFDALIRRGEIKTPFPFFTDDIMHLDVVGYGGKTFVYLGVEFKHPIFFKTRRNVSVKFLGHDYYPKETPKAGEYGEVEKRTLEIDNKIGEIAKSKGYDAIVTPAEIQVLDLSVLPHPFTVSYSKGYGYILHQSGHPYDGEQWGVGAGYDELYRRKYGDNPMVERFQQLANIRRHKFQN